ncbi:MAG: T9SS type A sorting domain-containing protein [Ignavibacteriaceae bacterium]
MRSFLWPVIITGLIILLPGLTQAQSDPFRINENGPRTVQSQDIFLNWTEDIDGGGHYRSYQKVYRYKTEGIIMPFDSLDIDTLFTTTVKREDNRPVYYEHIDAASGRFNYGAYDNTVSILGASQKIEILISNFDTTGFFTNPTVDSLVAESYGWNQEIYVRTGDFDSDSLDEFVIAYLDASDSVIFCIYDVDSTLQATQITRFSNTKAAGGSFAGPTVQYYLQTADLNGDNSDELILFFRDAAGPFPPDNIPVTVQVYTVENNNCVPQGSTVIQVPIPPGTIIQEFLMSSAKGQFDSDASDELFFSSRVRCFNLTYYNWSNYNYILKVSQDLQTITVGPRKEHNHSSPNYGTRSFCTAAGDLNDNKRDEAIYTSDSYCYVLKVNDDYSLDYKSQMMIPYGGSNDYRQSNNFLKASDINMDNKDDIIIVKSIPDGIDKGFWMEAFTFTDSTLQQSKLIGRLKADEPQVGYGQFAIAVGNYDGFDFTLGTPTLFHEYGVVQPIVSLNAPPVHFDIFDGTIYDVNACFNGGNCDFWALYKKETTTSVEVSTQVHKDWALSSGIKSEGQIQVAPLGVGVLSNYKLWAIGKVGEHFSKDSASVSTISISVEVQAREDDRIYSTISDYDIWEYPIIHGIETFSRRSLFALVPKNVQATWYSNKSYFALNSVPDHEVGNILSYYPYDTLSNNPNLSEVIRASYQSDRFELDGSSSYEWNLTFTDFQQSGASTEKNLGFDAGIEMGGIATNFKFDTQKMTTHKTSIKNLINLKVHLGSVNMGLGDVKYTVTPYAYWGKNDVLVLDYAVKPRQAQPGFPPTWWDDHYGNQPDAAFILPWRYDPEKGYALGDPDKRFQTEDITFIPKKPEPGDTLTITARVRNFSFEPISSPVSVSFYINDPDSGGTSLIGINGTNTITINDVINPQERSDVNFKLVVPGGLPNFPRIYAIIDQGNTITEIHENNNKGFNVLGASSVTGIDDENYILPDKYMLYQSYPNPFNPSTTISWQSPVGNHQTIKVFDVLGKEIATLVDEYKPAGGYEVEFDANRLASGVYFYQLRIGDYVSVKKMILIK